MPLQEWVADTLLGRPSHWLRYLWAALITLVSTFVVAVLWRQLGAIADPGILLLFTVAACKKALARAGLTLKDMDIIEINEAFAAQVLACMKGLGIAFDDSRINPNGGAIAVGHPLGASGARLALTAARQLQRSGGRYALVSLCIGGGQGMAAILERA